MKRHSFIFIAILGAVLAFFASCENTVTKYVYHIVEKEVPVYEGFVKITGATVSGAVSGSSVFIANRTLTIPDMYVCDHEVTQAEYETYCEYGSYSPSKFELDRGFGGNYPAYLVSWYDALVYCNLRSMAENLTPAYSIGSETDPSKWTSVVSATTYGKTKYCGPASKNDTWNVVTCDFTADGYRLPTEAEWEYAARGGNAGIPATQTTYSGSNTIGDVAWYNDNSDSKTHEVKTKTANSSGIYDMSGNVWEWCWDWYSSSITSSTVASGASSGSERVYRGGSWNDADNCEVANRKHFDPNFRSTYLGFRLVRSAQ